MFISDEVIACMVKDEDKLKARNGILDSKAKIVFNCSIHGYYLARLDKVYKARKNLWLGCPKCNVVTTYTYPNWFLNDLLNEKDKQRALNNSLKANDKVYFNCPIHGPYLQQVKYHINISTKAPRSGCPVCARSANSRVKRKYTYPDWFLGDIYSNSDREHIYEKTLKDKIYFSCSEHGPYLQQIGHHINITDMTRKSGCPVCGRLNRAKLLHKSVEGREYPDWLLVEVKDKESLKGATTDTFIDFVCLEHGIYKQRLGDHIRLSDSSRLHGCPKCVQGNYRSKIELEIERLLLEFNASLKIEHNTKGIIKSPDGYSYELDLYLPNNRLAIEVNGSFYHQSPSKPNNYHFNKFLACKEQGINLISIFDVDWYSNKDKIIQYLKSLLLPTRKVYARDTVVKEISLLEARQFCDLYHLQGSERLAFVVYGLYQNSELLAVMAFGKARYSKTSTWELFRFCVKEGVSVIGGASKLLKSFESKHNPSLLISYSDNDYFLGSVYPKLGFVFDSYTNPRYYWYMKGIEVKRERAQLKYLSKDYPDLYKESLSCGGNKEDYIMRKLGAFKVYRSGNTKWIKHYK